MIQKFQEKNPKSKEPQKVSQNPSTPASCPSIYTLSLEPQSQKKSNICFYLSTLCHYISQFWITELQVFLIKRIHFPANNTI
jgi:hypothetical protein